MPFTLFFCVKKTKSHIRHSDNLLLKCRHKGGTEYAREKILLGI